MAGRRFNPEKANKLLDPKRVELLQVNELFKLLNIQKSDNVADLGAGNGFFTLQIAEKTDGTVYAVDIEEKMLNLLKVRAEQHKQANIQYVVSDLERIQMPDTKVDKIIVAFVLHEVPNLDQAFSEMRRILKPDGKILLLEWEKTESEMGPPIHERILSNDMKEACTNNNFNIETEYQPNYAMYSYIISPY